MLTLSIGVNIDCSLLYAQIFSYLFLKHYTFLHNLFQLNTINHCQRFRFRETVTNVALNTRLKPDLRWAALWVTLQLILQRQNSEGRIKRDANTTGASAWLVNGRSVKIMYILCVIVRQSQFLFLDIESSATCNKFCIVLLSITDSWNC